MNAERLRTRLLDTFSGKEAALMPHLDTSCHNPMGGVGMWSGPPNLVEAECAFQHQNRLYCSHSVTHKRGEGTIH